MHPFSAIFARILTPTHEGNRYVNDPNDPGGETKFGISKRSYPSVDIRNLTEEAASAIYERDFWQPVLAMGLSASCSFLVFDFAINSGHSTAVRYLQRVCDVADDGHFGPRSAAAVLSHNELILGTKYLNARLRFMKKLKNWPHHNGGWTERIMANHIYLAQDYLAGQRK